MAFPNPFAALGGAVPLDDVAAIDAGDDGLDRIIVRGGSAAPAADAELILMWCLICGVSSEEAPLRAHINAGCN